MRRAAAALALMLTVLAAPVSAQNSGLDRLTLRDSVLGWEGVGRIDFGQTGFCTGTLIATDLVLTAAHCVYDLASRRLHDPATVTFRAGLADGRAIAEARVSRIVAHPGFVPGLEISRSSVRHDVALLKLAQPIPAATAAPFVVDDPSPRAREVSVVSYAVGRESALSWQRRCGVLGQAEGLLAFDCDVDFGSSGAPVFDRTEGRARVVSIVSSGRRSETGVIAIGMQLPPLVAELRSALHAALPDLPAPPPPPPVRRIAPGGESRPDIGARFLRP